MFFILQIFRVFYDRLVDNADRDWLFQHTRKVAASKLNEDFDAMFAYLDFDQDGTVLHA